MVSEKTTLILMPLLIILSTCYDNIEKKLYSGLVLIDLAKALDIVDHYILLQKFYHYGLKGIVNEFFKSFLKDISQFVSIDNSHFSLSNINIGVGQGSTLGPLLQYSCQMWSPRGRPWPRGHILKSLALASKPQVVENWPVLGSRTAVFLNS